MPNTVSDKVKAIPELAAAIAAHKAAGRRVAHCHGVFDLVHPGHLRHLQAAKSQGDVLVVTITADRFVNKGPGRPAFNEALRAEFLAAFEYVDLVGVNHSDNAAELIRVLKPDVYVKGSDYVRRDDDPTGKIYEEEQAIESVGGRICFTDEIVFSSSELINAHLGVFSPEVESWLKDFRSRHSADEVLGYIDRAAALRTLVVGEPIIDEYAFCAGLGKSSKDPILAFLHRSVESYAGGSLAVANHLAGLGSQVGLIAQLGDIDRREEFIRDHLLPSVEPAFPTRHNAPTIAKRRFVDSYTGTRMFEIYHMGEHDPTEADEAAVTDAIRTMAPAHDVVIVADYGHGMLTRPAVEALAAHSRFLVVNTQANAGNRGFNTISKYPRADYVCLANHEAQLEARSVHAPTRELVSLIASRVDCRHVTITRGRTGTYHCTLPGEICEAPALATHVTDRVGAGDAVLAVTGPMVASGAPWDIVAFVGNLAGAHMVADLGNRSTVNRASLTKAIKALLK